MPSSTFSSDQIAGFAARYADDGVVFVPGLLPSNFIASLLRCVDEVRAQPDKSRLPWPTVQTFQAKGRLTIRWMWRDIDDVRRFFTDSGVARVVAGVIGAKRLQYWYDLTFVQEPGADGEGSPWHHDIAAFCVKGTQIPSLWIALTDVSADASPLSCIRGSHRNRTQFRPPVYIDPSQSLPENYAEMPDVDAAVERGDMEMLTWQVKAGDALIIHPYTIHGAKSNRTDQARIAFTTRWAGDDVVWKPDGFSMKVPGLDPATLHIGRRPEGPLFPYVEL